MNKFNVLTEKEIKQKMAGYKSAYTKMVKATKTAKARKALEDARETYLGAIESTILAENKKAIQRRAGHLSWETRRANANKTVTRVNTATTKKQKTTKSRTAISVSSKKR